MKIELRSIHNLLLVLVLSYSFLFGGIFQFFIGLSPTLVWALFSILILGLTIKKSKILIDKPVIHFLLMLCAIIAYTFWVSLYRKGDILKPSVYSLFYIVPTAMYFLFQNHMDLRSTISIQKLRKYSIVLAVMQFPVLLVQFFFFNELISFNNSGQLVRAMDFQFGTFLLKNDHALGYFLTANLYLTWFGKVILKNWKKTLITIMLSANVFLTNSKISHLLFTLSFIYIIFINRRTIEYFILKYKLLIVLIVATFLFSMVYWDTEIYLVGKKFFIKNTNYNEAFKYFTQGLARREQILVVMLNEGISFIGNGAYTYFDIITGTFNKTYRHFSQLIWFYHDLGLVGLGLLTAFLYCIKNLIKNNSFFYRKHLFLALVAYSYFTIVTFDMTFFLIYFFYSYDDAKRAYIHTLS